MKQLSEKYEGRLISTLFKIGKRIAHTKSTAFLLVLKRTLESRLESRREGVFFHVSRESSFNSISHPMSAVVYQHQLVNVGGGIDTASGTFIVPRAGVYSFNFSGMKLHRERNETMGIDLRLNGKVIGVTRTAAGIDCGTLSLTAVLQLKSGDRIETLLRNTNKDGICRDLHCHFTGALLKSQESGPDWKNINK